MEKTKNAVFTLPVFRKGGIWMFNDPGRELYEEPFVGMANLPFELMYFDKNGVVAKDGDEITIYFSENVLPTSMIGIEHIESVGEDKGDTYKMWVNKDKTKRETIQKLEEAIPGAMINGVEIWLCPALLLFIEPAPKELFIQYHTLTIV